VERLFERAGFLTLLNIKELEQLFCTFIHFAILLNTTG